VEVHRRGADVAINVLRRHAHQVFCRWMGQKKLQDIRRDISRRLIKDPFFAGCRYNVFCLSG
jgi:hypothetical protein